MSEHLVDCGDTSCPGYEHGCKVTLVRPPREDYARVTLTVYGYTFEPAVEYREGDEFGRLAYLLRGCVHHVAHEAWDTVLREWPHFEAVPTDRLLLERMPDQMAAARRVGERIAKRWPDRAYFVEVWQDGSEGFAQVFQPFGLPRNR